MEFDTFMLTAWLCILAALCYVGEAGAAFACAFAVAVCAYHAGLRHERERRTPDTGASHE